VTDPAADAAKAKIPAEAATADAAKANAAAQAATADADKTKAAAEMATAETAKEKDLRQFAITRSCNAASAANDNSRPMIQAAFLINGAAASAVIAFLTKDTIDPVLFRAVPWALTFFAAGVISSAIAMYFMTEDLDYWNVYWEEIARGNPQPDIDAQEKLAIRWWLYVQLLFAASIFWFFLGATTMACAIWRMPLHTPISGGPG
jgi:hypothetical protein